jgi:hypothetical protein
MRMDFYHYQTLDSVRHTQDVATHPVRDGFLSQYGHFEKHADCPYCGSRLAIIETSLAKTGWEESVRLKICGLCGWWRGYSDGNYLYINQTFCFPGEYDRPQQEYVSILTTFDVSSDSAPLREIKSILANNWHYSKHISAKRAQDLVAEVFSNSLNCEVEYLADSVFSPDGGVDFVLVTHNGGRIAFQVKSRQGRSPESVIPVRSFIGAMALSGFQQGFFVTTADRFSVSAVREIRQRRLNLREASLHLTLVDGSQLRTLLEMDRPKPSSFDELLKHYLNVEMPWWYFVRNDDAANSLRVDSLCRYTLADIIHLIRGRARQ